MWTLLCLVSFAQCYILGVHLWFSAAVVHYFSLAYCVWVLLSPGFKVEFFLPFGFCPPKFGPGVCASLYKVRFVLSFCLFVCLFFLCWARLSEVVILSADDWFCIFCFVCCCDFPGGSAGKASVYSVGDPGSIPGLGRSSGEAHSSTLPWKITWTEEPDRLQSIGSQRIRHGLATEQQQHNNLVFAYVCMCNIQVQM